MDNRTRMFGGLGLVSVLFVASVAMLVWRSGQADDAARADDPSTDTADQDDAAEVDGVSDDPGDSPPGQGQLEDFVDEAVAFIEDLRGEAFVERPTVNALADADFLSRLETDLEEDFAEDPEGIEASTVAQRALGFIQPNQTSDEVIRQFLAAGVLGFYDPETKELVVRQVDQLSLMTKSTIVHELAHAFDDQHFDLDRPELEEDDFTEQAWTFAAIAEGSASHVENAWVDTLSSNDLTQLRAEEANFGDPNIFAAFDFAFLLLQVSVYIEGEVYVDDLVDAGGYAALGKAFDELPLTSEQIMELDPSIDLTPVDVPLPPADGEVVWEGVGGQVILDSLFAGTASAPASAATGWGGDALVIFRAGGQSCLRWDIEMDTEADQGEMVAGLRQWTAIRGGEVSVVDGRIRLDRCA